MNNLERAAFEFFLEQQLGPQDRRSFKIAALSDQGWDMGMLMEMAASYARTPAAARKFAIEFLNHGIEAQVVFKRHFLSGS